MFLKPRLVPLAFAGLTLWTGAGLDFVSGAQAAPQTGDCRIVLPRYEPKPRAATEAPAHFQGGARLSAPLAAPCPHIARAIGV